MSAAKFGVPKPVTGSQPTVAFQWAPGMTPDYSHVSQVDSSLGSRDAYAFDTTACLRVIAIAAIRLATGDVGETLVSPRVDPWVQETKHGLAGAKTSVVQ